MVKDKYKPTFIDLFAGIGGIRLAFQQAGFSCVYTNEINVAAATTYAENFDAVDVRDIREVDISAIPKHEVLCAGFPCQPFSKAGVSARKGLGRKHGFNDKHQGNLFFEIIKILKYHQPAVVFLENVSNLVTHNKGKTLSTILDRLKKTGYPYPLVKVIDASLLVPQRRKRTYIVAFREGVFDFPEIGQKKICVRDIFESGNHLEYTISRKLWASHKARTLRNKEKGNGFSHYIVDPDGIANTLTARYGKDGRENLVMQKGKTPRMLTPRECARLMGFPDDFIIPEKKTPAYRQLGNSVCVPVVRIIAEAIKQQAFSRHLEKEIMTRMPVRDLVTC